MSPVNSLESLLCSRYTRQAHWRRPGGRPRAVSRGRKVRTPRAGCWVTPRRSDPTPAPQRIDRRWPSRGACRGRNARPHLGSGKGETAGEETTPSRGDMDGTANVAPSKNKKEDGRDATRSRLGRGRPRRGARGGGLWVG